MDNLAVYILDGILVVIGLAFIQFGGAEYLKTLLKDKLVHVLVYPAEQKIKTSGMGAEKKAEVTKGLEKLGIKVDSIVDAMIEAAVAEINIFTKKAISKITE